MSVLSLILEVQRRHLAGEDTTTTTTTTTTNIDNNVDNNSMLHRVEV